MDSPATSHEQSAVRIARINAGQVIIVAIITAISGIIAGALTQGKLTSGKVDGLKKELTSSASKVEILQKDLDASAVEREALYRLTADYIEGDLNLTEGKGGIIDTRELSNAELDYRRLRRSVFLNMSVLRANQTILENTLQALTLRGHEWIPAQKNRIISEFPGIKATRLRWLEDVAIPALQRSRDEMRQHPMSQSVASTNVLLPREVWILNKPEDEPKISVVDMQGLRDEVDLLKRSL